MSELLRRHLATLDALEAELGCLSEAGWRWRSPEGGWCAAEVYDHIGRIATMYSFPRMEACLDGRGEAGSRRSLAGWLLLKAPWLAGAFRLRQKFPPEMVPREIRPEEARAILGDLRRRATEAAPRLIGADPARRVRHVRLGALNAEEWFAFAEIHSRHHLRGQLRRLMARPDFPKA